MFLSNTALATIETYTPGLARGVIAERHGIPFDDVAKLGSAENPLGPSPKAAAAVNQAMGRLDIYPEWSAARLRDKIAATYGVNPDQVVCGAGETEIMSWLIRVFAEPGGKVNMYEPCFPIYHMACEAEGRTPVFVAMGPEFDFRIEQVIAAIDADTRIVFLTNPHSPTGKLMDEASIRRVIEATRDNSDALVVLDEAYVHYTGTGGGIGLVNDYDNLIVLRTFSKVYGLAGLRVGFGIAAPDIIRPLMAIKPTWNMGQLQTAGAIAALDDHDHVTTTTALIDDMRSYVVGRINALDGYRVIGEPRSNFMLIEILDPDLDSTRLFDGLLERGVIVKDCSVSFRGLGKRYLRSDVSLKKHMDRLVDGLGAIK